MTEDGVAQALRAVLAFSVAHGQTTVAVVVALAVVALVVRLAVAGVVFWTDLRLRWRAGTALGRGGLVDRFVDAQAGDPMAHGQGERSLFYNVYMQSDAWRSRRRRTLMLAGGACQRCGARATDAHHATYDRLGQERDSDLLALCGDCHRAAHGQRVSD